MRLVDPIELHKTCRYFQRVSKLHVAMLQSFSLLSIHYGNLAPPAPDQSNDRISAVTVDGKSSRKGSHHTRSLR